MPIGCKVSERPFVTNSKIVTVSKPILLGILLLGAMLGSGGTWLLLGSQRQDLPVVEKPATKSKRVEKAKPSSGGKAEYSPQQASAEFAAMVSRGEGDFSKMGEMVSRATAWSPESTVKQAMQIEDPYKRREVMQQVFRYWIGNDQGAALEAIKSIENVALQRDLYRDALRWLSGDNPEAAITLLQADNNLHDHELWSRSFSNWARTDREAATVAVLEIEHRSMQREVLKAMAQRMADADLSQALEWAGTLKGEQAVMAMEGVLSQAARSNPEVVMKHLDMIPPGQMRRELISRAADEWAERDPNAALEWAESLDDAERVRAIGEIARSVFETDSNRAEEIIDLIPDSEQRNQMLEQIGRLRASVSIEEAMNWLSELPEGDRKEGWEGVAKEWARMDPEAAAEYGASAEDPVAQEQLIASASYYWAQRDPAGAAEWARSLEGRSQANAMYRIVENWARDSPAAAGEFVTTSLDGELQDNMTRQVVSRWLREDTNEASAWIDNLPNGSARDSAVYTLVGSIEGEFPATALQWANTIGDERKREYMLRRIEKRMEGE